MIQRLGGIAPNEWITLRIEVHGQQAKLFVNGNQRPVLDMNDLKHAEKLTGTIGPWVDGGTTEG